MSISPGVARGKIGAESLNQAFDDAVRASSFAVAGLPAAAKHAGKIVYVSNGASGAACLAYSNGTAWLRILIGAAVSAT
ncbi:hypothetical protein [Bradyrhizobium ottawaense]|uniref:hypothetical protein n=1 Tax=Bradyrhizobium ottawaense TaxID=931866 RepID=UPI000B825F50|nr:hypothetical protein [Bradyrhizobium ottawaense]